MLYGDRFKVFNGKRYYYQQRYHSKRPASTAATEYRKRGLGARVVKEIIQTNRGALSGLGPSTAYDVYATKKFA